MIYEDELIEEFVKQYPRVEKNKNYIIFTPAEDPEYCVLLFRNVKEVHCYYKGHGRWAKNKSLDNFDTPQEVLDWALSQREIMEYVDEKDLSPIDRIFLGLDDWDDDEDENEIDED